MFSMINFSNLGNLILAVSGAVGIFLGSIGQVKLAVTAGAIGVLGKAVCSAINEYQYPSKTSQPESKVPIVA